MKASTVAATALLTDCVSRRWDGEAWTQLCSRALWQRPPLVVSMVLLLALVFLPASVAISPSLAGTGVHPNGVQSVYVRPPLGQPTRVLVVVHGMGGDGEAFACDVIPQADRYGWLLVAPTIAYGDWMDPAQVAREDPALMGWLDTYLTHVLPETRGPIPDRVLLLGYSRGAQLASRFAETYPERVLAVAAVSAGAYTLPLTTAADGSSLRFPFGVGNLAPVAGRSLNLGMLRTVQFWVGVGGADVNSADVPRQWDLYEGQNRVARARAFADALAALRVSGHLVLFPGVHHELTPSMQEAAADFLAAASRSPVLTARGTAGAGAGAGA